MSSSYTIELIETSAELNEAVSSIFDRKVRSVAFDLEGESNRFRYGHHLCLAQVFDGETCLIIDTVEIANLSALKKLLTSYDVEKVMFAADFDARLIRYALGEPLQNIFDIQIAARVLEFEKLSLDYIIGVLLDKEMSFDKAMQNANWNLRPLKERQIKYAAEDVLHLLEPAQLLKKELARARMMKPCHDANLALTNLEFKKEGLSNKVMQLSKHFKKEERDRLKKLHEARDEIARELDLPPYRVFDNDILINASKRPPKNAAEWKNLKGFPTMSYRYVDRLLV